MRDVIVGAVACMILPIGAFAQSSTGAVDCTTRRLEWIVNGPLYRSSVYVDGREASLNCTGESAESVAFANWHRSTDGIPRTYLEPMYQDISTLLTDAQPYDDSGNCAFQALSGLLNYRLSQNGQTPTISPDFLSATRCTQTQRTGDTGMRFSDAIEVYRTSGSCDSRVLAGLAQIRETAVFQESTEALMRAVHAESDSPQPLPAHEAMRAPFATFSQSVLRGSSRAESVSTALELFREAAERLYSVRHPLRTEENPAPGAETRFLESLHALSADATALQAGRRAGNRNALQIFRRCNAVRDLLQETGVCGAEFSRSQNRHLSFRGVIWPSITVSERQLNAFRTTCRAMRLNDLACVENLKRRNLLQSAFNRVVRMREPVPLLVAEGSLTVVGGRPGRIPMGHFLLMTGKQKIAGLDGYWFRNSYQCNSRGDQLNRPTALHCDPERPGQVWIAENRLAAQSGIVEIFEIER